MCELEVKRILLNIVETRQFKPNGVKEATFFSDGCFSLKPKIWWV